MTELFVNDMNINDANLFSSHKFVFTCQVARLVDRFIVVSVVNNMLNIMTQLSEHDNEIYCPVIFTHMRNVTAY